MNISEKRFKQLQEKFFEGVDLTEQEEKSLMWLCGCEQETILNISSAFEKVIKKKNNRNAGRKADEPKREKIIEMQEKGMGVTAIAKELGCSRQNIYRILER